MWGIFSSCIDNLALTSHSYSSKTPIIEALKDLEKRSPDDQKLIIQAFFEGLQRDDVRFKVSDLPAIQTIYERISLLTPTTTGLGGGEKEWLESGIRRTREVLDALKAGLRDKIMGLKSFESFQNHLLQAFHSKMTSFSVISSIVEMIEAFEKGEKQHLINRLKIMEQETLKDCHYLSDEGVNSVEIHKMIVASLERLASCYLTEKGIGIETKHVFFEQIMNNCSSLFEGVFMLVSPSSKASIRVGRVFPCLYFFFTKFLLDSDSRGWNYEICEKFIDENDCDDQKVNQRNWIRIFQAIDELTSTQLELAFFYFKYAFNNYTYHRYLPKSAVQKLGRMEDGFDKSKKITFFEGLCAHIRLLPNSLNIIINEVTKKIVKSFIPLPHLEFLSLPCLEAKAACILQDTLNAESYLMFERRIASAKLMAFRSVADQIVYLLTKTKRSPREAGDFFRRLNELSDDELIDLLKTFKSWDRCAQTLNGSLTDFKNEPDTLFFALLLHLVMGNCPHPNEWSAAEFLSVGPLFQIFSLPIELGGYSLFIDAVDQPFRGDMESVVTIAEILRDVPQNNRKKLLIDALETIRGYRLPLFMHFERVLKELAEGVADGCENFAVGKKILSQVNDRNQGQMSDLSGSAQQYLQRISSKEHLQEVLRGVGLLNETLGSKGEQLFLELNALLDGEFISLSEAIELTGVLVDQRHALNTSHVGSWSAIIILLHAIPPTCRISRLAQALLSADQVVSADWLLFLHPEEIAEMMKAPLNSSIDLISAFKMSKAHSVWIFTCDFVKLLAQTLSGKKNLYLISFLRGLCKNTLLDCAGDEVPRWDLIKKLSKRDILASRLKRIQHLLSSELRLLNDYLIIAEWMDLTYPSSVDRGRKRSFDEMNSVNGEEKFLNRLCSALKSKTEINLNREGGLSRTIRILDQVLRKENERESLINATECLDLFRRLLSVHKEPWYESSLISGVDMIPRDLLPAWIEISALMKFNPQRVNLFLAIDCIRNAPENWLKLGKAIAALSEECRKSVFELLSKHCDLKLEDLLEMVGFCQTKEMVEQFKEHRLDWKAILSDSKGRAALGRAFANHLSNGCDESMRRAYLEKITSIESQQWRQEVVIVLFEELWKFGTKDFEVSLSILEEMSKECLLKEFLINLLLQYHDRTLINAAHLPLTNMIGRKVMTLKGLNWDESLFDLVEKGGMFPYHLEELLCADSIPQTPSIAIQKRYLAIYGQQINLYLYEMEDFLDCSKGVFLKACRSVAENFFGMMKCISEASPLAAEALFKNESYVEQMIARFLKPEGKKWLEEYRSIIHRSCPSIAQWVQNTYRYEQEENRCLYTQASYFDEDDHLIRINCPPLWVKDHPVEALNDLRISIYEALQTYILNKQPVTFYVNIFPSQVENNELTSDIGGVSRDYFGDLFKTLNRELVDNTTGLPKPEADLHVLFMMGYLLGFLVHNTQNITIGSVFGDAFYTVLCRLSPLDLRMGIDHLSDRRLLELTEGVRSVFGSIGAESEGAPLCGLSKFINWKGDKTGEERGRAFIEKLRGLDFFDGDFSLGSDEKSIDEKRLCEIQESVLKQYFAQLNLRNKLRPIFAIAGGTILQMIDRQNPKALKAKLQGVLSAEEILSTLEFTGVEPWVVKKISGWIQSMKGRREVLELFTEVISGSPTLPLNRDKDYMKVRMFRQGRVMTIDTCFNMLCLTDREKKENLEANLDWLLENIEQLNRDLLKLFGRN